MKTIYKLKENVTLSDCTALEEYGFMIEPLTKTVMKKVEQPLDGEAVTFLLQQIYENKDWKKQFYDKNKKMFVKEYKFKYDKQGKLIQNEQVKEFLTTWFCIIGAEDGWVGFTHCDQNNKMVYYGTKVIEKYCHAELFHLLSSGLVEEAEVEEE